MARNTETAEPRNVSLYPSDWAPVDALSAQYNLQNKSAALRIIIREWKALKQIQALRTSDIETGGCQGAPSDEPHPHQTLPLGLTTEAA